MIRSDYSEELDQWDLIRWRGAVAAAVRGRRGQALLRDLLAALDALPDNELAAGAFATETGEVCALGALGLARGIPHQQLLEIDPEDTDHHDQVAALFNVAPALVREIEYVNDARYWVRAGGHSVEHERWCRVREWVASLVTPEAA